jgi:hypothetical protein
LVYNNGGMVFQADLNPFCEAAISSLIMYQLCLGFLLNIIVFLLIGIGPTLLLLKPGRRISTALILSPAIGVVLTTVIGSWLVANNIPVMSWTWPWVVLASAGSTALALPRLWALRNEFDRADLQVSRAAIIVLCVAGAVLLGPQLVGGLRFSIVRGNGCDTMNYVAGAGFLDHERYSTIKLGVQALTNLHQSYIRARAVILGARWSTFMLLAFTSRVAGQPIYRFEYCFTLLFFYLACGSSYLIATRLSLRLWPAALVAVAIAAGFWAEYVLDIRAMSEINSIPMLLIMILLLGRIGERETAETAWGEHVLLGLTGAALVLLYPEICPMAALGLAIFFLTRMRSTPFMICHMRGYIFSLGILLFATMPFLTSLWAYLVKQVASAAVSKVQEAWVRPSQNWLYADPLPGMWGFSTFTRDAFQSVTLGRVVHFFFLMVGVLLTATLAWLIGQFLCTTKKERSSEMACVTSLTLACLVQAGYLLARHQLWAAGKALSYGYPFIMLAVAAFGLSPGPRSLRRYARVLKQTAGYGVLLWLVVQCGLGAYRSRLAYTGGELNNYMWQYGEYRQHDLDFHRFAAAIARENHPQVWSYISSQTVSEYAAFALGWETGMVSLLPTVDSSVAGVPPQQIMHDAQLLIADRNHPGAEDFSPDAVVAKNADLVLLRLAQNGTYRPLVVCFSRPIEMTGTGVSSRFWLGNDPVTLTVVSPAEGYALLKAEFQVDFSTKDSESVQVEVVATADAEPRAVKIASDTTALRVPVRRGLNEITLKALSSPPGHEPDGHESRGLGITGLNVVLESLPRR